jgi:hypothetical protein
MSTWHETGSRSILDWLLLLVVAIEVPVYFGAALLHLGARIPLGPVVLAVPNALPPAAIVETILGLAAVANLATWIRATRPPLRVTLVVQLFLLAGVSLGMVALALRVGPPPSPDWTIHYVMLAGIAAALVLTLLEARSLQGLSRRRGSRP